MTCLQFSPTANYFGGIVSLKKKQRVNKLLEKVNQMSDEEILEYEKSLYFKAGIRVVGGIGVLIAGLVVFSFMIPYL